MYLKSLSLRGFKSFADPTTLEFEPGVTVIVGPNGSGKSNVVDAVAWVLGAQGPRVVRSAKMDDVIFAGTQKRAALGRAEVSLTIDNSAGKLLSIDLAEVTITRTLFRSGESEYAMNGAPCRLLDIQELLSDAGVGRQQHVIVGQGQLDQVLQARPEDRRAVVEEAAGVLKFRRRRERAERRIEAAEANLQRLQDLHRELKRQLRPLERQAEAAYKHDSLAAELRALQLFVAGSELKSLRLRHEQAAARRSALEAEAAGLLAEVARLDEVLAACEGALAAERANDVATPLGEAERLREKGRGIANVIAERRRRVEMALTASTEADVVASLEAEFARISGELAGAGDALEALQPEREEMARRGSELAAKERQWLASQPAPAAGEASRLRRVRDGVQAKLASEREALARDAEREASLARQIDELAAASASGAAAAERLVTACSLARRELGAAEDAEREAAAAVMASEAAAREAVEHAHGLAARAAALQLALDEAHARAGVEHLSGHPGVLGTLLDLVDIDQGCELAFEAGVAEALGSVVVDGATEARSAIEHLRESGLSGGVVQAGRSGPRAGSPGPAPFLGERPDLLARSVRASRQAVAPLIDRLLDGVVLCRGDLGAALDLLAALPEGAVVVTLGGDRLSARGWRLGAGGRGATLGALGAVRIELVLAEEQAGYAGTAASAARASHTATRTVARERARTFEAASAEERQNRAQGEQAAERLGSLNEQVRVFADTRSERERRVAALASELEHSDEVLAAAEAFERHVAELADEAAAARQCLDTEARALASSQSDLEVRTSALLERRNALARRRDDIDARLAGYEAARASAADRREGYEAAGRALERLAAAGAGVLGELEGVLALLQQRRQAHSAAVAAITARLGESRALRSEAASSLDATRGRAQQTELEMAELRVRLEATVEAIRHDLEVEPEVATQAACPPLLDGTTATARVRDLEREIRLLGPVNPLALEELAGIQERDRFLSGQIEDVKSTRRDLARVVKAVDDEIVAVFAAAFEDVSRHFEALFATLFPGGSGRLTLVDPTDLLNTGIEIEVRPVGRNARRLSLLSGGERSLVALAFLFAVFRSRPSPFYLMDEVEAALDDINLHRFLDLVDEFRGEAQLLIVSHQKRTMEAADILYGVSLQPGGASKVVTERLRSDTSRTG